MVAVVLKGLACKGFQLRFYTIHSIGRLMCRYLLTCYGVWRASGTSARCERKMALLCNVNARDVSSFGKRRGTPSRADTRTVCYWIHSSVRVF